MQLITEPFDLLVNRFPLSPEHIDQAAYQRRQSVLRMQNDY